MGPAAGGYKGYNAQARNAGQGTNQSYASGQPGQIESSLLANASVQVGVFKMYLRRWRAVLSWSSYLNSTSIVRARLVSIPVAASRPWIYLRACTF
jgi:hypothetical protein